MAKVLDAGIKSYNAVLSLMAWVAPKTFKLILKSMKQSVNSLAVGFVNFLTRLVRNKYLITEMAKRDLARSYVGSVLGFFWTILNPLVMIFVLWGVFSVGLRITPKNDVPFVIWLTAGLAIWNAFVQMVQSSSSVITENPHLVKKVVFPLSILPIVKLLSSFATHLVFVALLAVMVFFHDLPFSLYWLQSGYYFFGMSILALGLSWIFAALHVFVRDIGQVVVLGLQIGFWGTPIFWDISVMPPKVQFILKFNPMYYIVQGYRDSFIYYVPFWEHIGMSLYFWAITLLVFLMGALIFRRLNPHFADVL